jgi:hypothetical protein
MKKRTLFWVALIALVPLAAWAGMTAISDTELQNVKGQTGITISMDTAMAATGIGWEDSDGYDSTSTTGAVILSGVTVPSLSMNNVLIDAGTSSAGTSFLQIATGQHTVTGTFTISSVIIGTSLTATGPSLGKFQVTGVDMSFGTVKIAGH